MSAITLQNMLDEKVQFKSSVSINQRMDLFNMELNNIRLANITEIPLYLALLLTKQHKGYIIIPEYMKEQYLQEKIVEESGIGFSKINDHFIEVTKVLLELFNDSPAFYPDINLNQIDALRNNLLVLRYKKLISIMDDFKSGKDLTNITQFELDTMDLGQAYEFNE
ncbi:GINS_complex protein [Hexamita inflata]|uniref:Putative n=1 Tax=Hexamita inflata TaxID=28002 RepID=A0ABP1IK24_9EUKA